MVIFIVRKFNKKNLKKKKEHFSAATNNDGANNLAIVRLS